MPPERTQRLWRALGFPDAADDDPAFTDADVEALDVLSTLIDSGFVGPETEASIARAMGQSLSRLADWQTDMLADALARPRPDGDRRSSPGRGRRGRAGAAAAAAPGAGLRLAPAPRGQRRPAARRRPAPGDRRELAVGFADLVGYTSRSRGMGGRELGAMVEDFESIAAEVIARHHGRVVKTVGDGVLFTAGDRRRRRRDRAASCPRPGTPTDRPPLRVGRRLRARCSPGSATSTRRWSTWPAG